jgi:hypothetical protein
MERHATYPQLALANESQRRSPAMREQFQELQKDQRMALLNIRRGALLFGLTAVGLLLAQHFLGIPLWIPFVILGLLSLTLIGDLIRYLHRRRQIKKAQRDTTA